MPSESAYQIYKSIMDPIRAVGATMRTQDARRTDWRTEGRTKWNQYTPNNFIVRGVGMGGDGGV